MSGWTELRVRCRSLLRRPWLSGITIASFALGIAAASSAYGVYRHFLIEPLPFEDPRSLVAISRAGLRPRITPQEYLVWKEREEAFQSFGFRYRFPSGRELKVAGRTTRNRVLHVSANYFRLLGIAPRLGRFFADGEDRSAERTVVISHSLWVSRFQSSADILGQTALITRQPYLIIGVAPPLFDFYDSDVDAWIPWAPDPDDVRSLGLRRLVPLGRLLPAVERRQARAHLSGLHRSPSPLSADRPEDIRVQTLQDALVSGLFSRRPIRGQVLSLAGVALLVLLVSAANAVTLALVGAANRLTEMGVRAALGAGLFHVPWIFLSEALILGLLGGGAGVVAGHWLLRALVALDPFLLPRTGALGIDLGILGFSIVLCLAMAAAIGTVPCMVWKVRHLVITLRGSSSMDSRSLPLTASGLPLRRFLSASVGSQIAIATLLLVGTGLLAHTSLRSVLLKTGLDTDDVLKIELHLPSQDFFSRLPPDQVRERYFDRLFRPELWQFFDKLVAGIEALSGVESVAATSLTSYTGFRLDHQRDLPSNDRELLKQRAFYRPVNAAFFSALGLTLLKGRPFTPVDSRSAAPVVIIDEIMANRYWPGENPLGRHLTLNEGLPPRPRREIVGVVSSAFLKKTERIERPDRPCVYLPYDQQWGEGGILGHTGHVRLDLFIRAGSTPTHKIGPIRKLISSLNEDVVILDARTLAESLDLPFLPTRFYLAVFVTFAIITIILAAIGIYGANAYLSRIRAQEMGIRMALGAEPSQLMRLILGDWVKTIAIGLSVGMGGSYLLSASLSSLLFEVSPTDPPTYLAVALFLIAVSLISAALPARSTLRREALKALRLP